MNRFAYILLSVAFFMGISSCREEEENPIPNRNELMLYHLENHSNLPIMQHGL